MTLGPLTRLTGLALLCLTAALPKAQAQAGNAPTLLLTGTAQKRIVHADELARAFARHRALPSADSAEAASPGPATLAELRAYTQRYAAFLRRVLHAEHLGLDTAAAFRREYAGYMAQVADRFLTDRTVMDSLVAEAQARAQWQVRARHLLIGLPEGAPPADTLAAWRRIGALRDSALAPGASFARLAARHSADPSAPANGGDLGWFTALDMVYPFESAAYATPVGAVSPVVRSQFGYHILKVEGRAPAQGPREAGHILLMGTGSATAARADSLLAALRAGSPLAELAARHSDDARTAAQGGALPASQRLPPALDSLRRALPPGQPALLRQGYGYHLFVVTDTAPLPPPAQQAAGLRARIARDGRMRLAEARRLARLRAEHRYRYDADAAALLLAHLGPQHYLPLRQGQADSLPPTAKSLRIAAFEGRIFTAEEVLRFRLTDAPAVRAPGTTPAQALADDAGRLAARELLAQERRLLPARSPEYAALAQEYRDGLLLFDLLEKHVWGPALADTAAHKAFYEKNPARFGGRLWAEAQGDAARLYQEAQEQALDAELARRYKLWVNDKDLATVLARMPKP